MRSLPIASFALTALLAASSRAADAPPAAPPAPYDVPADAPADAPSALATAAAPVQPIGRPRAAQASDEEAPRRAPAAPAAEPPIARRVPIPDDPSDAGRIVAESLLAYLASGVGLVIGVVVVVATGPGGFVALLAAPAATGGVVCAVGSGSDYFDGRCSAAIGGAYAGSLLAIPMAFLFGTKTSNSDGIPPAFAGALVGYLFGSTVGAVIGWNMSRTPKKEPLGDVARLDGLAASRAAPWREPLLPRGALLDGGGPRLAVPILGFRF